MNAISPREKQRRARQRVASAAELNDRLCWRISEWCRLTGTSRPTVWRQIKSGVLKVVYLGKIPTIPRSEGVRLGLIQ
jgi:predicted DNA-binding transcriptional regulator AlpA